MNTKPKEQRIPPHRDKDQKIRDAAAREPAKTNDADRDLVHGDGGDMGVETAVSDISQDD